MADQLRSIAGYPRQFASPTRFDASPVMMEDGELVREDGSMVRVYGAAAVGQSLVLSLSAFFADYSDPDGFAKRVALQGAPRPGIRHGRREEFLAQTIWDMEQDPEAKTADPRGMSLSQRIEAAIGELSAYLTSVRDVRSSNGHDVEIDYHPFGYETHVLRVDGLVPRPGARFRWKRALPIRRDSLLEVEDLSHRLLAHAKEDPELVRQVHWRTFERLVAELLDSMGWQVLELTRGSKDRGVDIYAAIPGPHGTTLAVIDCKKYGPTIGVEKVYAIAGVKLAREADIGMLVTTSYFTTGARDLERNELREHVQLHDFDRVNEWLAAHEWQSSSGLYLPRSRFSKDVAG